MGSIFYLMTLVTHFDPAYAVAADTTRRALLETPQVKQDLKRMKDVAERKLYYITGLTPAELAYAAYAYPAISGKISSKPFKNFKHKTSNGILFIPEIEYRLKTKESTLSLFAIKEF